MRLYCKLALLVLVTCMIQASLSTGMGRETYFAIRCYVASATGDRALESKLVTECVRNFAMEKCRSQPVVLAYDVVPSR